MGMKCVQCNTDNNLRDRTNNSGRCKQCNHPFVFEPTTITDKKFAFTDPFFKKAIEDISSQNMLFFTLKQFLYFIDERLKYRGPLEVESWLFYYLAFTVWGGGFFSIPISSMLQISQELAFFIYFIFYNVFWIWKLFKKSGSSQQGIRRSPQGASHFCECV